MALLPTGTVTFLMTDIEGSTRLWEHDEGAMRAALARHDRIVGEAIERHDGHLIKARGEGDSLFAVFALAPDAVRAALAAQRALRREPWPEPATINVRMAVHTGDAEVRDGADYYGPAVNRCARLRAAGHGGQILLSAATAELTCDVLPDDAELVDLGVHRLRDLARPERISLVRHPDLPAAFPPLATLERARHNLPVQLSSFVGRVADVQTVRTLVSEHRLVTLTGLGGNGKSRLALQVAADSLERFPGGLWFVALGAVEHRDDAWAAVAQAIGAPVPAGSDIPEVVTAELSGARSLVVLDGCEQHLDAAGDIAAVVLQRCPGVSVLATSREGIGVPGEVVHTVLPLPSPPSSATTVTSLGQYESVRLFVERAALVRPGFRVDEVNAPAIAQICHRLDGIPLAIELAAARVRVLDPDEIARRVDDALAPLIAGDRSVLPRGQTLRSTLDWSHETLSPAERALFRRLAVFPDGWPLGAAEMVCADELVPTPTVVDQLAHLVDRSLVQAEYVTGEGDTRSTRFRMLDTVRRYALEKLGESGEADAVAARLLDHVFQIVPDTPLMSTARGSLWQPVAELGGAVRQAVRWGLAAGDARAVRLVVRLVPFWAGGGGDGEDLWSAAAELTVDGETRVDLLLAGAWLARVGQPDYVRARARIDEAEATLALSGDDRRRALSDALAAHTLWGQGRTVEAVGRAARSVDRARQAGAADALDQCLAVLAHTLTEHGDHAGARAALEELVPRSGLESDRVALLVRLAAVCREAGDELAANAHRDDARRIAAALPDRERADALGVLAAIAPTPLEARELNEEALQVWRGLGEPYRFPIFWNLITVLRELGEVELAEARVSRMLDEQRLNDEYTFDALEMLANLAADRGDASRAVELAEEALAAAAAAGDDADVSVARYRGGVARLIAGDGLRADSDLSRARAEFEARGAERQVMLCDTALVVAAMLRGRAADVALGVRSLLNPSSTSPSRSSGLAVALAAVAWLAGARARHDDASHLLAAADHVRAPGDNVARVAMSLAEAAIDRRVAPDDGVRLDVEAAAVLARAVLATEEQLPEK